MVSVAGNPEYFNYIARSTCVCRRVAYTVAGRPKSWVTRYSEIASCRLAQRTGWAQPRIVPDRTSRTPLRSVCSLNTTGVKRFPSEDSSTCDISLPAPPRPPSLYPGNRGDRALAHQRADPTGRGIL